MPERFHILKTIMPRLTATERERTVGRLLAEARLTATERERTIGRPLAEDPRHVVANTFCVHSSIISRLRNRFQSMGRNQDASGGQPSFPDGTSTKEHVDLF